MWIANSSYHRWHERTAQCLSVGGHGSRSNGTRLVFRLWVSLCTCKQFDNRRLAIDLSALKQLFWNSCDDCDEEVDGSKGDYPRWIDTFAMLSDCWTKTMTSCWVERNVEYKYLRYETHWWESRHQNPKQEVESIEERAWTVARSWQLISLVFAMLVEVARLKHDIIQTDFVPVKLPRPSETCSLSSTDWWFRCSHSHRFWILSCSARSSQSPIFWDDPAKVTPRVTGVTFSPVHLLLCHLCICVQFRRALESQAKRCFHISHHIGIRTLRNESQATNLDAPVDRLCPAHGSERARYRVSFFFRTSF